MNRIVTIYCEGKAGSHDFDIISKVIDKLPNSPQIEPIGGVKGAGAIIQYRESGGLVAKSDAYFFFRDRDFDKAIPENPCLERDEDKEYIYFSYRNTIENYLFNPKHIFDFTVQKNIASSYDITDEIAAKQKLIIAAERIKVYQAVRHTMGKMRTDKTNFGTRWTDKSGVLPDSLDKDYCMQKAIEKISVSKGFVDAWTEANFHQIFAEFLDKFDDAFMNNLDFLSYFHGKDLAKSFGYILPNFPLKDYYLYAKKHFDFTQFLDLVELRKLLEQNI
jgi:hypothetical protein